MMKKIPLRKCVVTGEQFPKKELLRIVRTPTGEIHVDLSGRANGHGAYLKKEVSIVELAKKNKALERAFKMKIDENVYEEILRAVQ
ncbi:RNase P modulator RnpM [Trueperella sp. zg.1013]|uniref:RNase P modulator RnpM n=2 Tax=Bacillati TaxID=1783272 RepID=UPI001C6E93D3|nr:YlxR family protein [Trueperella sp. zg.1013]MBW9211883.1 YlxR family protein [Trueperella sp. zg.1013]